MWYFFAKVGLAELNWSGKVHALMESKRPGFL